MTIPRRLSAVVCALGLFAGALVVETPVVGSAASPPAELVSLNAAGNGPDTSEDGQSTLSGNGLIVAYSVNVAVPGGGTTRKVMVRDRLGGTTTTVPFPDDTRGATLSRDGCTVAFWGFTVDVEFFLYRLQVWNRCTGGAVKQIDQAFSSFGAPADQSVSLSADGHYVGWANGDRVIGVTDTVTGATNLVADQPGTPGPTLTTFDRLDLSDDGNTLAFAGNNGKGVYVYAWNRASNSVDVVSVNAGTNITGYSPSVSADGRYVAYISCPSLRAGTSILTVRDRVAGVTKFVAAPGGDATGNAYTPDINPDGTQVAVVYNGLTGCFFGAARGRQVVSVVRTVSGLYDTVQSETVSYGVDSLPVTANDPSISSTGRWVSFDSSDSLHLMGVSTDGGVDVWVRERPPRLTAPKSLDFGTVDVGATSPQQIMLVRNPSNVIVPIVSITPATGGFHVIGDGCTGQLLQPGATCPIVVVFAPSAPGPATGSVTVNGDGATVTSTFRGTAVTAIVIYHPKLLMNPGVAISGDITFAVGTGFPPSSTVSLSIEGVGPLKTSVPVVSDAAGNFRVAALILVSGTLRVGGHQVVAADTPNYTGVRAPLLVQLGTFQPAASLNPAFLNVGSSVVALIGRSG